jgi:hypothetical protein
MDKRGEEGVACLTIHRVVDKLILRWFPPSKNYTWEITILGIKTVSFSA